MTSRREVLRSILAGAVAATLSPRLFALDQPKPKALVGPDLTDREKIIHVMNRMSFGFKPAEVDHILLEGGWQAWVKQQLAPDSIDDAELDKAVVAKFTFADQANILDVRKRAPEEKAGNNTYKSLHHELPKLVLTRAVESKRRFKEVIAEFWRNHFCVDLGAGDNQKSRRWTAAHYEDQVIRKHLFGKFKDMLFASARHPAMLEYLDNQLNHANYINENYAREVMELHTLGADRGYDNSDVAELSKILTGWQYNNQFQFAFNEAQHQPGTKFWLRHKVPQGYDAGEKALYYLATHQYTADFISTKLVRYLVNDNPPPALVKKVAAVFMETEGDLPKLYAAIFNAPEFFNREHYRSKFKTPFQVVVSAIRATDAKLDDAYASVEILRRMAQPIYECTDPTGYFDKAESWMDAGVLTTRWDYAWRLVRDGIPGVAVPKAFVQRYEKLDPSKRVAAIVDEVVGGDVGDRERKIEGDTERVLGVLLCGPSFQQR